jgi:hypothetical protein
MAADNTPGITRPKEHFCSVAPRQLPRYSVSVECGNQIPPHALIPNAHRRNRPAKKPLEIAGPAQRHHLGRTRSPSRGPVPLARVLGSRGMPLREQSYFAGYLATPPGFAPGLQMSVAAAPRVTGSPRHAPAITGHIPVPPPSNMPGKARVYPVYIPASWVLAGSEVFQAVFEQRPGPVLHSRHP